jgi:FkbM family methyltransferase
VTHLFTWANLRRLREVASCRRETKQWFALALAYLRLRQLRFPYELRLRSGQRLILHEYTDVVIFWLVFVRRHYPVRATDRVVVDVGANIGVFTLYAAREAPGARIIALEPFPDTRARLLEMAKRNRLADTVTILDCALAGWSGTGAMDEAEGIPSQYRRIYSEATKTLNAEHRGKAGLEQSADGIAVRKITLCEMLEEARVASADLVKMNIHGSEYEVLLSTPPAVLRRCARIAVQYHEMPAGTKLTKYSIFERLSGAGFKLVLDDDTGRGAGRAIFALHTLDSEKYSARPS